MYESYTNNDNDLTKDAPDEQPGETIEVNLDALDGEKVEQAVKDAPVVDKETGEETAAPAPTPAAESPAPGEQGSDKGGGLFNL